MVELTHSANLVPLSLAMRSSDMSLPSVMLCQCGRLVIELVEHGTEVMMVGLTISVDS